MTAVDTPADISLATLLREGSRAEHERAESSTFVGDLLDGRIPEAGYVDFLIRLAVIYDALENAGRQVAEPFASAVVDAALERGGALETDVAFWSQRVYGERWTRADAVARGYAASPTASAYAARIAASVEWGGLFVAHHYTRYLGDLSGGQVIGRALTRVYDLEPGDGVSFFEFPLIPKPKLYKDAYRARLDALSVGEAGRLQMLDEVRHAFDFNGALFKELAR